MFAGQGRCIAKHTARPLRTLQKKVRYSLLPWKSPEEYTQRGKARKAGKNL